MRRRITIRLDPVGNRRSPRRAMGGVQWDVQTTRRGGKMAQAAAHLTNRAQAAAMTRDICEVQ